MPGVQQLQKNVLYCYTVRLHNRGRWGLQWIVPCRSVKNGTSVSDFNLTLTTMRIASSQSGRFHQPTSCDSLQVCYYFSPFYTRRQHGHRQVLRSTVIQVADSTELQSRHLGHGETSLVRLRPWRVFSSYLNYRKLLKLLRLYPVPFLRMALLPTACRHHLSDSWTCT